MYLGEPPTGLMAVQIGHDIVEISWTVPTVPPIGGGYRITIDQNIVDTIAFSSPHILTVTPGVHSVRVMSRSSHYPGMMAEIQFIMKGKHQWDLQ